ncbi:hypothetical protein BBUWI9123_H0034 (plasmid) [Borreliella burgdorferi WI91-23]|nr:hypothetical protein BBUWI9123_H0034 [Borreliella burgdorferi WI91-23]
MFYHYKGILVLTMLIIVLRADFVKVFVVMLYKLHLNL